MNMNRNFDNIGQAILTLFEIATTEGWVGVMHSAMDATAIDQHPVENYNKNWCYFFMLYMIIGAFFAMNLFVGGIINDFQVMKAEDEDLFMSEDQRNWSKALKMMLRANLP